jgi:uncharacterized OB-fold protein
MQKALAPDIWTWPEEPLQLIGSRCESCGAVTFPRQRRCPRCSKPQMVDLRLPSHGVISAWTTQGFPPKLPYAGGQTADTFVPFGMALVALDDVVQVEGRLTENDPAKLRIGLEVELRAVPFYTDENGDEVLTYAFEPTNTGNTDDGSGR